MDMGSRPARVRHRRPKGNAQLYIQWIIQINLIYNRLEFSFQHSVTLNIAKKNATQESMHARTTRIPVRKMYYLV